MPKLIESRVELRNVRIDDKTSEETLAFHANLYLGGRHVARVENTGKGGATRISHVRGGPPSRCDLDELEIEAAKHFYQCPFDKKTKPHSVESFLFQLADQIETIKRTENRLRHMLKTKSLFRPVTGELRSIKAPLDARVRAYIENKYPGARIYTVADIPEIARQEWEQSECTDANDTAGSW